MLDVAIIGAGLMGRWHLATAQALGARIVAVVDPDETAASRLAKMAPGARVACDLNAIIGDNTVQAAHVCSPAGAHLATGLALAEAGIHALVEKPLTATAGELHSLVAMAERHGVYVCPVHQYAFQPGLTRSLADIHKLGAIRRIDINICSAGANGLAGDARDAVMMDILPHPISLVQRIAPFVAVDTIEWAVLHPAAGEMLVTGAQDDLLISIFVSLSARPTEFAVKVQCTGGSVEVDGFHGFALSLDGQVSRHAKITQPFRRSAKTFAAAAANLLARQLRREPAYAGLRDLTRLFYEAILSDDPGLRPISHAAAMGGAVARDVILTLAARNHPPRTNSLRGEPRPAERLAPGTTA